MSWVKLDDLYAQCPKMIALGDWYEVGLAMDVAGLCWAALHEQDGRIPKQQIQRLINARGIRIDGVRVTPTAVAERLVMVGRWHDCGEHYEIHNFLKYNPSRAEQDARREATKARVKRHRNAVTSADETPTKRAGNIAPGPGPGPVPDVGTKSEKSRSNTATATPELLAVLWNETAPAGMQVTAIGMGKRLQLAELACREMPSLAYWRDEIMPRRQRSAFLRGDKGDAWKGRGCTFDWLLENHQRVAEGQFDDSGDTKPTAKPYKMRDFGAEMRMYGKIIDDPDNPPPRVDQPDLERAS